MDLNFQVKSRADDALIASYTCPCGCNPRLPYQRGTGDATDDCCCGNQFAIGPQARDHVRRDPGFALELQPFQAPWGEPLQAAWAIGPSKDPNGADHEQDPSGHGHEHGHDHAHEHENGHDHEHDHAQAGASAVTGQALDPVCGMTIDIAGATEKGLHLEHEGVDYYFCGKGCFLEFRDDPARFLDPSYTPSM